MPYRLQRNVHGGGALGYVREDFLCKILKIHKMPNDAENILIN